MTTKIHWSSLTAALVVCMTAGCGADADREGGAATLGQSLTQSGPYANFSGLSGKKAQEMTVTYNVTNDATGPAATYFVSTQFGLVDSAGNNVNGGYIGLQPYSGITGGHTAVFSIFGATAGTYANGTPCIADADGGPGRSCLIAYNYAPNTNYTMRVQHVGGGVYKGYINGALIATITLPGSVAIGNDVVQWLEPYGGTQYCESAPYFTATASVPAFVPAVTLTKLAPTYGPGYCRNVKIVQNSTHHAFEIGTPSPATGISLKAKNNARFVYAVATAEGCGGGGLKNDGLSYTKCARFTEVDRAGGNVLLQTENGKRVRCLSNGTVAADERGITPLWVKSLGPDGYYSYKSGTRFLGSSGTSLNCSATALGDAQRFNRTLTPAPNTYRLRNVWQNQYLVDVGAGRAYYSAGAHVDSPPSHWVVEDWGAAQKRFKNRHTGLYMNNEGHPVDTSGNPVIAMSAVPESAYSGAWTLEEVAPATYRLQNFWTNEYVTTEKQLGYVDLNTPGPGWLSAQWAFEPVVPYENRALAGSVTGSTQAPGQEFTKVRDGVVSGYPLDSSKEWSSAGQKAGAWIQYSWSSAQPLVSVTLHDRINLNDQVLSGTLSFSDGSSVAVGALPNDGAASIIRFAQKSVTWMRFTVSSVSGTTANVGLAELEAR
ncbi:MAG TPA: hypothetical protein VI072_31340 [Polyangiaceae bacterium]